MKASPFCTLFYISISNVISSQLIRRVSPFIHGFEKRFGLSANELVLITHSIVRRHEQNTLNISFIQCSLSNGVPSFSSKPFL